MVGKLFDVSVLCFLFLFICDPFSTSPGLQGIYCSGKSFFSRKIGKGFSKPQNPEEGLREWKKSWQVRAGLPSSRFLGVCLIWGRREMVRMQHGERGQWDWNKGSWYEEIMWTTAQIPPLQLPLKQTPAQKWSGLIPVNTTVSVHHKQ